MTDTGTRTGMSSTARLVAAVALIASLVVAGNATGASAPSAAATPRAHCGPGSLPETTAPGRGPAGEDAASRPAKGSTCNTKLVAHIGTSGGYKVLRYVDKHGHVCA